MVLDCQTQQSEGFDVRFSRVLNKIGKFYFSRGDLHRIKSYFEENNGTII